MRNLIILFLLGLAVSYGRGGSVLAIEAGPDGTPERAPAARPGASREVRLRLEPPGRQSAARSLAKGSPVSQQLRLLQVRRVSGRPPRQRNPELSPDHLVLKALDARGRELTRIIIPDPRLLRAETAGPVGELRMQRFYRESVDFTVALPDDPGIRVLGIYQPRWEEAGLVLDLIGEAKLP